jgi:RimJ/RimL family protein N-acetyltransferase
VTARAQGLTGAAPTAAGLLCVDAVSNLESHLFSSSIAWMARRAASAVARTMNEQDGSPRRMPHREHVLRTPRLLLRRWTDDDIAPMAAINRDPEVTRYLNRRTDEAAVAAFVATARAHWEDHGFGFYAIEPREPGAQRSVIGFAGVAFPAFLPELAARPELGWRLASSAWGRGLATEAATAARDDALGRLRLRELISIIHPRNARSQRVAAKLGMGLERRVHNPVLDLDVEVWQMSPRA